MSATSSEGFPSVASTATDPAMSLTRSPLTSSKSRLVGASMVHCVIPPVLPVWPPVTPKRYISSPHSQDISRTPRSAKTASSELRLRRHPLPLPPRHAYASAVRVEHDHEDFRSEE